MPSLWESSLPHMPAQVPQEVSQAHDVTCAQSVQHAAASVGVRPPTRPPPATAPFSMELCRDWI